MSATYSPSADAVPQYPQNITFLSQRDLALQIPIPYVTAPGVAVTAACFPRGVVEDASAALCIANLLASGFRRLVIDVYWDAGRGVWSLCPVQLPSASVAGSGSAGTSSANATFVLASSGLGTVSAGELLRRQVAAASAVSSTALSSISGTASTSVSSTVLSSVSSTASTSISSTAASSRSTSTSATTTISRLPKGPNSITPLYKSGPYTCSVGADLGLVLSLLEDFFDKTNNNVAATIKYAIFNLHAAASGLDPTAPATQPSTADMPTGSQLIGMQARSMLDGYLYTPRQLRQQRSNLNATWYTSSNDTAPEPEYYVTEKGADDIFFSPNAWPSESFLEFADFRRILVAVGTVDPQMATYDFASDGQLLFTSNTTSAFDMARPVTDLSFSSSGALTSGCFFAPAHPVLSHRTNSSWALTTTVPPNLAALPACGISPLLNATLDSSTAADSPLPYASFVATADTWSWAPSEPALRPSNTLFRCAALHPSPTPRWHVADCATRLPAACRANGLPYVWTLSRATAAYTGAAGLCPANASFAVPRTALENAYLGAAAAAAGAQRVWLDFNSLDVQSCWVVGADSECPYDARESGLERTIVVPVVAAVVVMALAVLTVGMKCVGNRRDLRRGRGGEGWVYEGVPQ